MNPEVAGVLPLPWAVAAVKEPFLQLANVAAMLVSRGAGLRNAGDLLPGSLVGPAREGHGPAAKEQLAVRGGERAAEAPRSHLAKVAQAKRAKVHLQDVSTGGFGEPGEDGGGCDRLEAAEFPSAEQTNGLAFARAPDDEIGRAHV